MSVFISYAHEDRAYADAIYHILTQNGIACWYDTGLIPGDEWETVIANQIASCRVVLVLQSANSANVDGYVGQELNFARENKKTILPIILQELPSYAPIRLALGKIQWLVYNTDRDFQVNLVAAVCELLGMRYHRADIQVLDEMPPLMSDAPTEEAVADKTRNSTTLAVESVMRKVRIAWRQFKNLVSAIVTTVSKSNTFKIINTKIVKRVAVVALAVVVLAVLFSALSPNKVPLRYRSDVENFEYEDIFHQALNTYTLKVGDIHAFSAIKGDVYYSSDTRIITTKGRQAIAKAPGEAYVVTEFASTCFVYKFIVTE